jgi:hypothetical protein
MERGDQSILLMDGRQVSSTLKEDVMTDLIGWAHPVLPEGPLSVLDHTYVTSTDGMSWGCWADAEGGREICRGLGDQRIADCLSQPWGTASIVYAATGVCHQTANRILRPSRQTVCQAQGYAASWALYGPYGHSAQLPFLDPVVYAWKTQEAICGVDSNPDPVWLAANARPDSYFEAVSAAHTAMVEALQQKRATEQEAADEVSRAELDALASNRIVTGLAAAKLDSIARSRRDMLAELQEPLQRGFPDRSSIADAADRANRLVNDFLASAAQSLAVDEFKSLFDVAPGTHLVVARPDIVRDWIAGRLQGMMVTKAPRTA